MEKVSNDYIFARKFQIELVNRLMYDEGVGF